MQKQFNKFIRIYGAKKEVERAENVLRGIALTEDEPTDRLAIQSAIDTNKLRAVIAYDGNFVWSFDRVIRDFKRALKSKPCKATEYGSGEWNMTDYLYEFLSLACGSIAHFSKHGWIGSYPTKQDLRAFCFRNEFGKNILKNQPSWKTDSQKIAKEMMRIARVN